MFTLIKILSITKSDNFCFHHCLSFVIDILNIHDFLQKLIIKFIDLLYIYKAVCKE